MTVFVIDGPYDVPLVEDCPGKMVAENPAHFWIACSALKPKIGCYVFALRAGKGFTPLYVGKTAKSFEQECFTDHKIKHYNYALAFYKKGTPVMFFVTYPLKKGKPNKSEIKDVEDFLIQVGRTVNPQLRNIIGTKQPTWGIKGVIRGGKGKSNKDEADFRRVFKL